MFEIMLMRLVGNFEYVRPGEIPKEPLLCVLSLAYNDMGGTGTRNTVLLFLKFSSRNEVVFTKFSSLSQQTLYKILF